MDENNTRLVWPLVIELCHGERIDNRFLQAMMYAEPRLVDDKGAHRSLLEMDNKRKLVDAGVAKIMREIGECAAFYNRGGERVFAEGVLRVVNYRRQIKITLRGSKPLDAVAD